MRKAETVEYEMNLSLQSSSTDIFHESKENDKSEGKYFPQSGIYEKYQLNSTTDNDDGDDMPYEYRYVWNGPRSVQEEYYIPIHSIKSELHVSEHRVKGSICISAKIVFGRNEYGTWKKYDKGKPTDKNTLGQNSNRTEASTISIK